MSDQYMSKIHIKPKREFISNNSNLLAKANKRYKN